jgi:hypothetical protein
VMPSSPQDLHKPPRVLLRVLGKSLESPRESLGVRSFECHLAPSIISLRGFVSRVVLAESSLECSENLCKAQNISER